MPEPDVIYRCTMLTGTIELKPVEYRVACLPPVMVPPPWWAFWRQPQAQTQWSVETDYMSFGPFDTEDEAQAAADFFRAVGGRR